MNCWLDNKFIIGLFIVLFNAAISQNQQITFDVKITSSGKFDSPNKMSEAFLQYFLTPDSSSYSVFYSEAIMCLLMEEEINNDISSQKITSAKELCSDSVSNKIFNLTANRKRKDLFRQDGNIKPDDVEVLRFKSVKRKTESMSKYKFDLYDLHVDFKDKKTGRAYVMKLFNVYHLNYKWYFLDPSFEIIPE